MQRAKIILVVGVVLLLGCKKNEGPLVHPDLQVYLDDFKEEAAERGITVDYEKTPINILFISDIDRVELGWCSVRPNEFNTININVVFWPAMQPLEKERLVFHELGHCYLKRSHLETERSDGFCLSIMNSAQGCADNYSEETRDRYLDELFGR